ncbi:P-loop containing nucleoside triphosphate hydrolase protein [Jaminaea rosea]|uniref:P-loop containing nucleoside triphosphate hydrolase protein n=1 Tax=Jaminaea rosea TaxID=1569628 RepID=A0A316UI84_9BASI|nr:P-loop containing nucleoside triphosphate hydrolase protein [Jaminaea rosea]PWN24930.1 P-loop containing nucleoside triphosphate hydrolase protein [Jaminaea rosea]
MRSRAPRYTHIILAAAALLHLLAWISIAAYDLEVGLSLVAPAQPLLWTYALVRSVTRKAPTPPFDLLFIYATQALANIVAMYDGSLPRVGYAGHSLSLLICALALTSIFAMPLSLEVPIDSKSAGEDRCSLWQWMTFSWLSPLISTAVERTLEKDDVWKLSRYCQSTLLLRKFKQVKGSTLPRRILRANNHDILLDLLLTLVSAVLAYASPFFLKRILEAIENASNPQHAPAGATTKKTAYLYALLSLTADVVKSQTDLQHLFYGRRACIRIRGQLISAIYEKALKTRDMNGVVGEKGSTEGSGNDEQQQQQNGHKKGEQRANGKLSSPDDPSDSTPASIGKIVSLAAVDSIRISAQAASAYMLYSAPIEFIVASLFLYRLLGLSAFAGFLVLLVASPLQSILTRRMIQISKHLSAARDKRLSALNEVTQNLKFVKYYAFEEEMKRRVLALREVELGWLKKRQRTQAAVMLLWTITPAAVTTVSFAFYVLVAKRDLDVSTAFTSIALFQLLRGPLNALPMQVNEVLNAKVASDRIEEFMRADEVAEGVTSLQKVSEDEEGQQATPPSEQHLFGCEDATFQWPEAPISDLIGAREKGAAQLSLIGQALRSSGASTPSSFQLSNITFLPPPSSLTLVIGPTGSGKSALLSALLGEMALESGVSHMRKDARINPRTGLSSTIAYCAQTPWLQHASIRANILFGSPMEQSRYDAVLDACALRPDLEVLEGDLTEIGEKGVSLSGGQQARVALARAVYSRAATLFLDDPLSAVDAHTADKLVRECFAGPLMKGRTVVLVTHHADLVLARRGVAKWVVAMSEGKITRQGEVELMTQEGWLDRVGEAGEEGTKIDSVAANGKEGQRDALNSAQAKSNDETEPTPAASPGKARVLVEEEHRARGGVKKEVYKMYLEALGYTIAGLVVAALISYKLTDLAEKGWLAFWGASYRLREEQRDVGVAAGSPSSQAHRLFSSLALSMPVAGLALPIRTQEHHLASPSTVSVLSSRSSSSWWPFGPASTTPVPYLLVFFLIQLGQATFIFLAALLTFHGSLKASRSLFVRMLDATMGATSRWLDKTPSGRIVNKFSRDVEVVDASINQSLRYFVTFAIAGIIAVLTIVVVLPPFVVPMLFLAVAEYYVARGYIRAARDLRRLESVSRSPIFSAFSELLQGISTVRAYAAESRMLSECTQRIDLANSFFLYFWMCNRWLLFRLDILSSLAIFVATLAALRGTIAAGLAGLALTQAQSIVQASYWMARMYTTLEQDANSIERVREALDETPQEEVNGAEEQYETPPEDWPAKGGVEVKGLVLRYAPELPPVLHGISFSVKPGEKVGIVGRTGSGKSTTALAFFRFVAFDSGSIEIDGVDISKISLRDLRSRLTIIPQNAVLFSGTIRDNLDPFGQHTDQECEEALHAVRIRTTAVPSSADASVEPSRPTSMYETRDIHGDDDNDDSSDDPSPPTPSSSQTYVHLATRVAEGGSNFSQGQRQLLAMARALLRRTRLILMDEASSAVDLRTDALIQRTVRRGFRDATVITIAHRLATVVRADKVLVLDKGKVVEFGEPLELMGREAGVFRGMCEMSGDGERLRGEAEDEVRKRNRRSAVGDRSEVPDA